MASRRDWLMLSSALRQARDEACAEIAKLSERDRRLVLTTCDRVSEEIASALAAQARSAGLNFDVQRFLDDAGVKIGSAT